MDFCIPWPMRNIQRLPRRRHDGNDVEGRLGTVDMASQEKCDEQKGADADGHKEHFDTRFLHDDG